MSRKNKRSNNANFGEIADAYLSAVFLCCSSNLPRTEAKFRLLLISAVNAAVKTLFNISKQRKCMNSLTLNNTQSMHKKKTYKERNLTFSSCDLGYLNCKKK